MYLELRNCFRYCCKCKCFLRKNRPENREGDLQELQSDLEGYDVDSVTVSTDGVEDEWEQMENISDSKSELIPMMPPKLILKMKKYMVRG